MKIIGTLDTKDDADLLPVILRHLPPMEAIFAFNDGSTDNTEDILKASPRISKYVNKYDFSPAEYASVPQFRRHHLLKMVMDEYSTYNTEEIWIVRLESDRFFLNQNPWEMCNRAKSQGHTGIAGVMLDCRLDPSKDWKDYDTYPNWPTYITHIQDHAHVDDVHPIVAFKVEDGVRYSISKPRPWPVIWGTTDYQDNDRITNEMAFFAHHGRRGPKYWSAAYGPNGIRIPSKKWPKRWDFSTPESAYRTADGGPFRPEKLMKLTCVANQDELDFGHYPYLDSREDINAIVETWNSHPTRQV